MIFTKEYTVTVEEELLSFLKNNVSGSKNNIKSLLTKEMVSVNNKIVTQYNYMLKVNDIVSIGARTIDSFIGKIKIVYEDNDLIVVSKPSGMLTIATEDEKDNKNTLYNVVLNYIKKKNSNANLYVVHRLDKDTSGVLMFSKNELLRDKLQKKWNQIARRIYYAIVYGSTKSEETLTSYLKENDNLVSYSSKDGKLAITHYKKIKENENYSLLEIEIKTGRRNQIRVQLKEIGHPIVGDSKYGYKNKNVKRMLLHAFSLTIINPLNGETMSFESPVSSYFNDFVR